MTIAYNRADYGQNKTAGTSFTENSSNTISTGQALVVVVAKDNVQTTDGQTSEVTSVTDSASNTWTKVAEFTNGQGAANGGATVAVWCCKNVTTASATDVVTANLSSSITAKAMAVLVFDKGASTTLEWDTGFQTLANDAVDPGNMTISSLASREYLFFRAIASEGTPVTGTASTNYTLFTSNVQAGTTGGGGATNMSAWVEYRIVTGTGDSSNPTVAANDSASLYIAFYEQSTVTFAPPPFIPSMRMQHNLVR